MYVCVVYYFVRMQIIDSFNKQSPQMKPFNAYQCCWQIAAKQAIGGGDGSLQFIAMQFD